jgi:nitronate monooxygenase/enoyl-[acyl-carrier protein] reductase II
MNVIPSSRLVAPIMVRQKAGTILNICRSVNTMALVPQVVDAVSPVPVVAAGGIFDGRDIAAAPMIGAAAVNLGTRFLASEVAPSENEWKQAIVTA